MPVSIQEWLGQDQGVGIMHIQDYLEQLALAMGDEAFPESLAHQVGNEFVCGVIVSCARHLLCSSKRLATCKHWSLFHLILLNPFTLGLHYDSLKIVRVLALRCFYNSIMWLALQRLVNCLTLAQPALQELLKGLELGMRHNF